MTMKRGEAEAADAVAMLANEVDVFDDCIPYDPETSRCGRCNEMSKDHVYEIRKYGLVVTSRWGLCPEEAYGAFDAMREVEWADGE